MKKILFSLFIIGLVGGVGFAATQAFFSDTETSAGNTFTAGELDLKIDNTCYYNGLACRPALGPADEDLGYTVWTDNPRGGSPQDPRCSCTWGLKDLVEGDLFFDFQDLKPDDESEDTISLRVQNDAYACMSINKTEDDDETCTEPESLDDPTCNDPDADLADGELGGLLSFVFWNDDGDNVLEHNETVFKQGAAAALFDGTTWTLADSLSNIWTGTGGPMTANQTYFIGKAWCFGTLTTDPVPVGQGVNPTVDPGVDCDGTALNNASQTDKFMADVEFSAVQQRNNPNFTCGAGPSPTLTPTPTPTPTPDPGEVFGDQVTDVDGTFGHCCDSNNLSSDPAVVEPLVTGAPDSPPDTDFIQISDSSSVTIKFVDNKAIDGVGADIRIHIYDALFPATAQIEVGQGPNCDTTTYFSLGNHLDTTDVDLDISSTGLSEVQCVRLTDLGTPDETFPTLGFDLDAIEALNSQAVP